MNAFKRRFGLLMSGVVAAASLWACVATRNGDGSIKFEFAPDMTITAWGLEDALRRLIDLLGACTSGNYVRPCTQDELTDISNAITEVAEVKERMRSPKTPSPGGTVGV